MELTGLMLTTGITGMIITIASIIMKSVRHETDIITLPTITIIPTLRTEPQDAARVHILRRTGEVPAPQVTGLATTIP